MPWLFQIKRFGLKTSAPSELLAGIGESFSEEDDCEESEGSNEDEEPEGGSQEEEPEASNEDEESEVMSKRSRSGRAKRMRMSQ